MNLGQLLGTPLFATIVMVSMTSAKADSWWAWTYSGPGVSASGTLSTAGWEIYPVPLLTFEGVRNGEAITDLVPLGTDPGFSYDNLFLPYPPLMIRASGILYATADNHYNIYSTMDRIGEALTVTYYETFYVSPGVLSTIKLDRFTITAIPEPEEYATAVGVALLFAGVWFRTRKFQAE